MRKIGQYYDAGMKLLPGVVAPSDYIDARVLAATVAEVITVPAGATFVMFSGTADFYVRFNAAATIPSGDVTDGTASELNPQTRVIYGPTIGIISPVICIVTLAFYS